MVTGRGLYGICALRASDVEDALPPEVRAKVVAAHNIATLAELPEEVDDYILRAATYTAQEVEEAYRRDRGHVAGEGRSGGGEEERRQGPPEK